MAEQDTETILLTGATGFIGCRLLEPLLKQGVRVRAVSRRPARSTGLKPQEGLEILQADVGVVADLARALEGVDRAYYMVHSMEGGPEAADAFVDKDRAAALEFSKAAKDAGVKQIIYLSGLEPPHFVSKHLQSRNDVEGYLGRHGVPVTTLRAGFIIGPKSAGFQMLGGLIGNLTVMMVPAFMHNKTQPAWVDDVVDALIFCAENPELTAGRTFDLGSEEVIEYFDLVREYCVASGRTMEFIEVPWAPSDLAAAYTSVVSGLPYALVSALSHGLQVDLLVQNERLYELAPQLGRAEPMEAMRRAFREL
ncbi:MAG: NAD(P)H-binding protein [Myxococcota bacterium]